MPNQANDASSLEELASGSQPLLADSDLNISEQFVDSKGQSGIELDNAILDQFSSYNDGADYTLIPSKGKAEYNSNSLARSISEGAGVKNYPANLPGYDPGTSNVLPGKYFNQGEQ